MLVQVTWGPIWRNSVGFTLETQSRGSSSATVCGLNAQEDMETIGP